MQVPVGTLSPLQHMSTSYFKTVCAQLVLSLPIIGQLDVNVFVIPEYLLVSLTVTLQPVHFLEWALTHGSPPSVTQNTL